MKRSFTIALLLSIPLLGTVGCASGRRWVNESERVTVKGKHWIAPEDTPGGTQKEGPSTRSVGPAKRPLSEAELADAPGKRPLLSLAEKQSSAPIDAPPDARFVGVFRNTYYDFPSEADFQGNKTKLMNASCSPIREVPRGFFEAVCVQGSGTLLTGKTVSFAKRDCACAEQCPRTGQKICFDELDQSQFPWGRGALGKPIVPLRTIAVDSKVIPLGTPVYIAEFDGVARSPGGAPHDGCFIAEDRGLKVEGQHVDIFTGNPRTTSHLNSLVPSNKGVHVFIGTARCQSQAP